MPRRFPWKQNVLKLPPGILHQAQTLKSDNCVAAVVRRIPDTQLRTGQFAHLNIMLGESGVEFQPEVLPSSDIGRYSRYNIYGREIVLKDEPMVSKTYSVDAPNFGDRSKGSHEVSWDRDVYQREVHSPMFLTIKIDCLAVDVRAEAHAFKFSVSRTLDRKAAGFRDDLLSDINLLQENTGGHNVYESDMSSEDFLRTLYINWEILPLGARDENITRILTGIKSADPTVRSRLIERYDFLLKLKPRNFIKGTSGFLRYFGAQFSDQLVVFENVEYGNAAYVMREDWQSLSRLSRTELLTSHPEKIVRIAHTETWKARLKTEILAYR